MTPEEIQEYVDNRVDARLETIADMAAERAIQKVYAEIGRGILRKLVWLTGATILAFVFWLAGKGVKIPTP